MNSERTFRELTTFIISKTGKIQAEDGFADDLVMSLGIASEVMSDVVSRSPIPIVKGDLMEPGTNVQAPGFSRGTYNQEYEDYRKWV